MRVLITGGAGFIGQHVASRLADSGEEVVALDSLLRQVHADPEGSVRRFPGTVVRGDVADEAAWASLPEYGAIIHLAAETGTAQSMYERERYQRVNVDGTRLAAETAVRRGIPIIALSSRAVYGEGLIAAEDGSGDFGAAGNLKPSHEDDPHDPVSYYGETKSMGEAILTGAAKDVPVTIIRPQNVVGPGQALHNPYTGVLAAFLARLREGRSLAVYGDGSQTRDFVHVSDLADLIIWNLQNPANVGEARILNCGTGSRTTLTQLAEYAIAAVPTIETRIEYVSVHRAGDIDHACADLRRLRELGAPMPRRSSAEAVRDFVLASWDDGSVASSDLWDRALQELEGRGLTDQP